MDTRLSVDVKRAGGPRFRRHVITEHTESIECKTGWSDVLNAGVRRQNLVKMIVKEAGVHVIPFDSLETTTVETVFWDSGAIIMCEHGCFECNA